MELRLKFNEDVENYEKARPTYPNELFNDIIAYSGINECSNVLEIGIGTGQATLPFLKLGCSVTAVELGRNLAEYAKSKFSTFDNLHIINDDFTKAPLPDRHYDLVLCATAFHWLPKEEAYTKIKNILKPGGSVALFWNHPFPNREDDEVNTASRKVYDKYRPTDKPIIEFSESDLKNYEDELRTFKFAGVKSKLYKRTRTLSAEEYISLLNTYSDHRALPDDIKAAFEKDMLCTIEVLGGKISIYDTIDLYLAKSQK